MPGKKPRWRRSRKSPERLREICAQGLGDGVEVAVWWQNEARVGNKNEVSRRRAPLRPPVST
ncbi:MAG: hypothetical protein OXI73_04820 [Rhodospirillales bacterium]|nr:hypothetical protein [Rhodospirillales bacterium]